jgi:hypothetical protein
MKADGRTFRCESCRQIILFFSVLETPTYIAWLAGETETRSLSPISDRE